MERKSIASLKVVSEIESESSEESEESISDQQLDWSFDELQQSL